LATGVASHPAARKQDLKFADVLARRRYAATKMCPNNIQKTATGVWSGFVKCLRSTRLSTVCTLSENGFHAMTLAINKKEDREFLETKLH
jgi:hypothetical protein